MNVIRSHLKKVIKVFHTRHSSESVSIFGSQLSIFQNGKTHILRWDFHIRIDRLDVRKSCKRNKLELTIKQHAQNGCVLSESVDDATISVLNDFFSDSEGGAKLWMSLKLF